MSKAVEIEATPRVAVVAIAAVAVVLVAVAAAWVGRERARQSTECIKAGGEWTDAECRRKP